MATLPLRSSRNEQHAIVFFVEKNTMQLEIHSQMHPVYGNKCL